MEHASLRLFARYRFNSIAFSWELEGSDDEIPNSSLSHRPEIGKVACDLLASLYSLNGSLSMSSNFRRLTRSRSFDRCWTDLVRISSGWLSRLYTVPSDIFHFFMSSSTVFPDSTSSRTRTLAQNASSNSLYISPVSPSRNSHAIEKYISTNLAAVQPRTST